MTHIGSGSVLEIDAALSILVDLVHRHPNKMAAFAAFIKGIVDYMENLSNGQIRKLYLMLSVLSFQTDHGRTLIQVVVELKSMIEFHLLSAIILYVLDHMDICIYNWPT